MSPDPRRHLRGMFSGPRPGDLPCLLVIVSHVASSQRGCSDEVSTVDQDRKAESGDIDASHRRDQRDLSSREMTSVSRSQKR